jgi:hypothetical protein
MANGTDRTDLAIAQIHFPADTELRRVVATLAGIERAYAECAFLDATLEEADTLIALRPPNERWTAEVTGRVAKHLLSTTQHERFDAGFAIAETDAAPRVLTARPSQSWVVDLIGKLNPIEALRPILEIIRDWRPDRDRKHLANSKLAQEVVASAIANQLSQLDLIERSAQLLRQAGVGDEEVQGFVSRRISNIASAGALAAQGVSSVEVSPLDQYRAIGATQVGVADLDALERSQDLLPGVWSMHNRILPGGE